MTTLTLAPKPQPPIVENFRFGLGEKSAAGGVPIDVACAWKARVGADLSVSLRNLFENTNLTAKYVDVSASLKDSRLETLDFDMQLQEIGTGERAGTMSRFFEFDHPDGPSVHHSFFWLLHEFQDAGLAKRIFVNSLKLYEHLGVERITLTAGLEVGGYAWARYGFKPDSKKSLRELYDKVRENLGRLDISTRSRDLVSRLMRSDDPKTVWALSDLDMMVTDYWGERMKLGKALLLGTTWDGELDLKDEESRVRFQQYVSQSR